MQKIHYRKKSDLCFLIAVACVVLARELFPRRATACSPWVLQVRTSRSQRTRTKSQYLCSSGLWCPAQRLGHQRGASEGYLSPGGCEFGFLHHPKIAKRSLTRKVWKGVKWCEISGHTSIFLTIPEISHHFIPFYTILYHSTPFFFACVFAFSHRSQFFFLQMRPGGLRRSHVGLASGVQV